MHILPYPSMSFSVYLSYYLSYLSSPADYRLLMLVAGTRFFQFLLLSFLFLHIHKVVLCVGPFIVTHSDYCSMNTNRKERGISDACRTICAICDYNLHVRERGDFFTYKILLPPENAFLWNKKNFFLKKFTTKINGAPAR